MVTVILEWTMEPREYVRLFWADWITLMTTGFSLICPFAQLIFKERVPSWLLWLVSALCFLYASYRVWRGEHRNRQAAPFEDLIVRLELARIRWKKHEHDFQKRTVTYMLFMGTPSTWPDDKTPEYKDRIISAQAFYEYADSVTRIFNGLPLPPLVVALSVQGRDMINGNQLDEFIIQDNAFLLAKISDIRASGLRR